MLIGWRTPSPIFVCCNWAVLLDASSSNCISSTGTGMFAGESCDACDAWAAGVLPEEVVWPVPLLSTSRNGIAAADDLPAYGCGALALVLRLRAGRLDEELVLTCKLSEALLMTANAPAPKATQEEQQDTARINFSKMPDETSNVHTLPFPLYVSI